MTSFHPAPIVGRRKEAIVRVRLMPGTGQFTLNGRSMDSYFPNKVHQQLIREPLVTLDRDGQYDVIASLAWPSREPSSICRRRIARP
jgi:small subunit ribosomal protein S9